MSFIPPQQTQLNNELAKARVEEAARHAEQYAHLHPDADLRHETGPGRWLRRRLRMLRTKPSPE